MLGAAFGTAGNRRSCWISPEGKLTKLTMPRELNGTSGRARNATNAAVLRARAREVVACGTVLGWRLCWGCIRQIKAQMGCCRKMVFSRSLQPETRAIQHQRNEVGQGHKPLTLAIAITRVKRGGDYKLNPFGLHLVGLASRYCGLKGGQVLRPNPLSFWQYLAPAVLACGFRCAWIIGSARPSGRLRHGQTAVWREGFVPRLNKGEPACELFSVGGSRVVFKHADVAKSDKFMPAVIRTCCAPAPGVELMIERRHAHLFRYEELPI